MTEITSSPKPPSLSLAQLHQLTAATARYESGADPESILRSGLVEEVAEYTWESGTSEQLDKDKLEGELGDVLWYVSEISRYRLIDEHEITDGSTLDDFQTSGAALSKPVTDKNGNIVTAEGHPQGVLAVAALRVVDTMNPKHDDLWLPDKQRLSLGAALRDLLIATSWIAQWHNISLTEAARHTLDKLNNRPRKPHVIDEVDQNDLIASRRERLNIHPFIGQLIISAYASEVPGAERK